MAFFDSIKNVMQFIGTVVAFPGVILTVVYFLRNLSSGVFLKYLFTDVYNCNDSDAKERKKVFRTYVRGNYLLTEKAGETIHTEKLGYFRLMKKIRKYSSSVFVIYGEVGSGKSSLMRHIALNVRKRFIKDNAKNLSKYDIAFIRVGNFSTVSEIINEIDNNQPRSETILIDAIDELRDYINDITTSKSIIDELYQNCRRNGYRRIVFSTRKQAISHDPVGTLIHLNQNNQSTPVVVSVESLQKKQVLKLYKKRSKKEHEPLFSRIQNAAKLKKLFAEHKTNIFCNPFIASWASAILNAGNKASKGLNKDDLKAEKAKIIKETNEAILFQNYYTILARIVEMDLQREADKKYRSKSLFDAEYPDNIRQYVASEKEILRKIVTIMLEKDKTIITTDDIEFTNNIISRRLLHFPDRNQSGKLEFMHSLIYSYLACNVLIQDPTKYDKLLYTFLSRIRKKSESSDMFSMDEKMYLCGVYAEFRNSLNYKDLNDFLSAVHDRSFIKHKKGSICAENLAKLLKPFEIKGVELDNQSQIDIDTIEKMQAAKVLNLQNRKITSSQTVRAFDLSCYNCILLNGNKLTEFTIDVPIKTIDITNNPSVVNAIRSQPKHCHAELLIIDANRINNICLNPSVGTIRFRLTDNVEFSPLYQKIWNLRKDGADVDVLDMICLNRDYITLKNAYLDKKEILPDTALLQAIYELDTLTANRLVPEPTQEQTDRILSYLTICLLYLDYAEETETRSNILHQMMETITKFIQNGKTEAEDSVYSERFRRIIEQHCFYQILWDPMRVNENKDLQRIFEQYFRWRKKSAAAGDAYAMSRVGQCLRNGFGTKKDEKQAFEWLKKSADAGSDPGKLGLGQCYNKAIGTDRDEDQAFRCFKEAAEAGNELGMLWLGVCYEREIGTKKDEEKAFECYKKSAEQGNERAMLLLARCYRHNTGTERDEEKAFYWCRRSAEKGDVVGMVVLGFYYEEGIGTEQNLELAFFWYSKAEEIDSFANQQAVTKARKSVVRFYREGIYVEKSEEKARELEEKWHLI